MSGQTGLAQVQLTAVTYDTTDGYSTYRAAAQSLVISDTGVTATPVEWSGCVSTGTYNVSSDGSGNTIITLNGTTIVDEPTENILSLSLNSAAQVNVDFTNGDPLPLSGLYSNAAVIALDGPHGSDDLVTTSTAAFIGSDEIRFPSTTQIQDNLTTNNNVIAVSGTVNLAPSTTYSSDYGDSMTGGEEDMKQGRI